MTGPDRTDALARVQALLLDQGVSEAEVDEAAADDVLDLLVADRLLVPGRRRFTVDDVSERTGMAPELVRRFWRALGFADVDPDERAFTELDVEAIRLFQSMVRLGAVEVNSALQLARVVGSSMARIAEAEMSPAVTSLTGSADPAQSVDNVEEADRFARQADASLPAMARLLEYTWRRHLQAATRRAMYLRARGQSGTLPALSVGFADMVGFTVLSQQLAEEELAAVVGRFEQVAHDTITARGGRVVKMIGDEAMFVTESVAAAGDIALSLAEAYADDELLSDVRVALAHGPVLLQDGDYFGPVVNLASRTVTMAEPGTVLVSEGFHDTLAGQGRTVAARFTFRALRPRVLKDLGRVQLWALRRADGARVPVERRAGRRFQRIAEALPDLDELRERGERLLDGVRRSGVSSGREPQGGDAERPQLEAPVHRRLGTAPEVDEPR
jgi:adenylate cyclase